MPKKVAIHVWTDCLKWNRTAAPGKKLPAVAIRFGPDFRRLVLVDRVEGDTFSAEPVPGGLPGTPGVEVAVFADFCSLDVHPTNGILTPAIELADGKSKEAVFQEILDVYLEGK